MRKSVPTVLALLMAPVLLGLAPAKLAVHPKDGPDVDLSLRVDAREGRLLVRVNGVAVDGFVGLPGEHSLGLDPAWADSLGEALLAELRAGTVPCLQVTFDEAVAALTLERAHIETGDPANASLFPVHGVLASSVLELELALPRPPRAQWIDVQWQRFELPTGQLESVPLVAQAGARRQRTELRPDAPNLRWEIPLDTAPLLETVAPPPPLQPTRSRRFMRLGAIALVAAGYLGWLALQGRRGAAVLAAVAGVALGVAAAKPSGAPLEDAEAQAIFASLQRNLYASFASVDRGQVYDALSACVDGPLLEAIFTQVTAALVVSDHGAARGRVEELKLLESECIEQDVTDAGQARFRMQASWQVRAIVEHSGHSHRRWEEYAGVFDVVGMEPGWRITAQDLQRQERVQPPQDQ